MGRCKGMGECGGEGVSEDGEGVRFVEGRGRTGCLC